MKKMGFYIVLPFLYAISILPFSILYLKSRVIYFLLYSVFGYRKKVVYTNLKNSFPEKNEVEIKMIAKAYFKHLADLFVETIKSLTISGKSLKKHIRFEDPSCFQNFIDKKQPFIILMSHTGIWEWASFCCTLNYNLKALVIYKSLSDKNFDKLFYNMRKRFGAVPVQMENTFRKMVANKNEVFTTAFIADQTPAPENAFWFNFLNQDTPFFKGAGILSNRTNYPVVYVNVRKEKRGHYLIHTKILSAAPKNETPEGIIKKFAEYLEADIKKQPEIWLWSHRRWKHKRVG